MSAESSGADRVALGVLMQEQAGELAQVSVDLMYEDPFWIDRFGERGRRYALEDARHHVTYLAEALVLGSVATLTSYARWLQTVLTTRGMCSKHLADHFDRLAQSLGSLDRHGVAAAYLRAAKESLLYEAPLARAIQLSALQVAIAAHETAYSRNLPYLDNPAFLLSYLGDAIALGGPQTFVDHVAWLRRAVALHRRSPSDVDRALDADARLAAEATSRDRSVDEFVAAARAAGVGRS